MPRKEHGSSIHMYVPNSDAEIKRYLKQRSLEKSIPLTTYCWQVLKEFVESNSLTHTEKDTPPNIEADMSYQDRKATRLEGYPLAQCWVDVYETSEGHTLYRMAYRDYPPRYSFSPPSGQDALDYVNRKGES